MNILIEDGNDIELKRNRRGWERQFVENAITDVDAFPSNVTEWPPTIVTRCC